MSAGNDAPKPPGDPYPPLTDRRLRNSVRPPTMAPPSENSRDAANEDFLFHLYRGSELLQDNRIHEAKTELEFALGLQPRDPKGQDLLALVYFRIGLYPHAIQIYEELLRDLPEEPSLKLNLALCYLKTGQAGLARTELEEVVANHPDHRRAWGYLGLAYQRTGDLLKAHQAFERGGHSAMSKRMADRASIVPPRVQGTEGGPPPAGPALGMSGTLLSGHAPPDPRAQESREPRGEELRVAAAVAFEELDSGVLSFALAEPEPARAEGGTWHPVEPGVPLLSRSPASPARPPRRRDTLDWGFRVLDVKPEAAAPSPSPIDESPPRAPRPVKLVAKDAALGSAVEGGVTLVGSGLAVVRIRPKEGQRREDFAVRLEAVRSYSGAVTAGVLQRQSRGQVTQETFGGIGAPLAAVTGDAELVLGPRPAHRIVGFSLEDDVAFLREEVVLGFELRLPYENGRLAVGDGEVAAMVQLHGSGSVLIELMEPLASLEVTAGRSVHVRREALVGWVGRLVPREVPLGEAPLGQRGLVGFSGEGAILLTAR